MSPKIVAFSGSARKESVNQKLVSVAAKMAKQQGATVTLLNLADFPMPLFNEDLEASEGLPEHAQRFKDILIQHDAMLVACPEYNSSITPLLKNAIDWASRRQGDEPRLYAYQKKVVGLLAASPGALGGLRGLVTVRSLFGNIGCTVIPEQFALGQAGEAFDEGGMLVAEAQVQQVQKVVSSLVETAARLSE